MNNINDQEIKTLVLDYQKGDDNLKNILDIIGKYVYNYPRICYKHDLDGCSEFFLYVCDRMENILKKYQETQVKFTSWLIVVLKNHYLNWIEKQKKCNKQFIVYDEEISYNLHEDRLPYPLNEDVHIERDLSFQEVKSIINTFPKKVRVIVKLHYFDFFEPHDLNFISEIFHIEYIELLNKFNDIYKSLTPQYFKRVELMDKITAIFQRIQELNNSNNKDTINLLPQLKLRHQTLLNEYKAFYISINNKDISEMLGINLNAVHNLLFRARVMLSERLKYKVVQSV